MKNRLFLPKEKREASFFLRNNPLVATEAIDDRKLSFNSHDPEKPGKLKRRTLTITAPMKLPLLAGKFSH